MAALNEIAYGYPPGDFAAVAEATGAGLRIYFGSLGEEEVATCATWRHGGDAELMWVAVAPEGRGRGVSGRLAARALSDAREDGAVTSTLQSTKLGYPVYEALGYRDLGVAQMWERREPGD
jgi:GNAT superfamily N-acetyltransferase